jgi:hypothetical protein
MITLNSITTPITTRIYTFTVVIIVTTILIILIAVIGGNKWLVLT